MSLIMCICPVLTGCFDFVTPHVGSPNITLHATSLCLSWGAVENARKYEIYCNDEMVNVVTDDEIQKTYVYDFSPHLTTNGEYKFYVITRANYNVADFSEPSNEVVFNYDSSVFAIPIAQFTDIETTDDFNIACNINGNNIIISSPEYTGDGDVPEVDGYELYLYSTSTGLKTYPIELSQDSITVESISNYNLKYEIYALRIGVVVEDEHYVCSDIKYINPVNEGKYSSNIYLFDGYINDMYLDTIQELNNLVYYSFISRIPTLEIRISEPMRALIYNYTGANITEKLGYAFYSAFTTFLETRESYSVSVSQIAENDFKVDLGYLKTGDKVYVNRDGNAEPDIGLVPSQFNALSYVHQNLSRDDKYYDMYEELTGNKLRIHDPNYKEDFISDRQFLYQEVTSSEELYWAVENKITPICTMGSRAEKIYSEAKKVLKTIISDDMTDYEKVQSIFDWICDNTSYDYYSVQDESYGGAAGIIVPVFYLEGVFMTGYAVCDGFSKAFSLMCNMEGIDAIRIVGTANTGNGYGGHAWNKVKLDSDPTDEIGGEYYLVDLTWTTFISSGNSLEVGSHWYFLVGDDFVKDTHFPYGSRGKFNAYKASNDYNYFDITEFEFTNLETNETIVCDKIIDSEKELQATFHHVFAENQKTIEVIIDYDFLISNYNEYGEGKKKTYENIISLLIETMRGLKIDTQLFELYHTSYSLVEYNSEGDAGIIFVFRQRMLFDDAETPTYEIGNLINYVNLYQPQGSIELIVEDDFFKAIKKTGETAGDAIRRVLISEIEKTCGSGLLYSNIKSMSIVEDTDYSEEGETLYYITFEYNNNN